MDGWLVFTNERMNNKWMDGFIIPASISTTLFAFFSGVVEGLLDDSLTCSLTFSIIHSFIHSSNLFPLSSFHSLLHPCVARYPFSSCSSCLLTRLVIISRGQRSGTWSVTSSTAVEWPTTGTDDAYRQCFGDSATKTLSLPPDTPIPLIRWMLLCDHTHTHSHTHTQAYKHTLIKYAYRQKHTYTNSRSSWYRRTQMNKLIHRQTLVHACMHIQTHMHTCMLTHMFTHTCINTLTHTPTHTCTPTRTFTHTRTHKCPLNVHLHMIHKNMLRSVYVCVIYIWHVASPLPHRLIFP